MEEKKRELLIIIPAYNEAENIEAVIRDLREKAPGHDILLVDDGSTDDTPAICRKLGLRYARHRVNAGLSAAVRTGMKYAVKNGYDYGIQFDADGQHDASAVERMLERAKSGKYNIVIGSRYADGKLPFSLKTAGMRLISFSIRLTTAAGSKRDPEAVKEDESPAVRITDPTSGLRIYDRSVMKRFVSSSLYGPEPDTLAYLIRHGIRVSEVGVTMHERKGGRSYLDITESVRYMFRMCASILLVQWFRRGM